MSGKKKRTAGSSTPKAKGGGPGGRDPGVSEASGRTTGTDGRERDRRHFLWAAGLILLASFIVYGNSLGNDFAFDDFDIFVNQKAITNFSHVPKVLGLTTGRPYYRPIRFVSYMIDYSFSGRDPIAYHVFNILYHALAGIFVYLIAFRVSGRPRIALLASVLFVIHPVQTDSVTYLSGRRDVLCGLFYLMGFYWFLKYRDTGKFRYAVSLCGSYLIGLFTKEMTVTLPAMMLIYDVLQRQIPPFSPRQLWRRLVESLGRFRYLYPLLFALAGGFAYLKAFVSNPSTAPGYYGGSVSANFMTVAKVLLHHILLLLFPLKLNADYSYNAFPVATGLLDMRVLFSLAVLLVIFLLIVRALASRPMAAFAGLWFFVTLLPTYHIIPHHELLAEHYLYLPMFAFAFLAAWGVDYALERSERRSALVWAAAALVLIAFSGRTIHRNRDWKDDLTLWKKTVKTAPQCARAHVNLGKALIAQGDLKWAIAELKTALQIKPDLPTAFANLGVAYGSMDMYDEAVRSFEKALQVHPRFPGAYYNLGLTLARKGDMDGAAAAFEKAVAMDPNMSAAHYNLGLVYLKRGDSVRARRHLSRAAGLLPDSPMAARAREALRGLGDR